jgi:hypothetical protein
MTQTTGPFQKWGLAGSDRTRKPGKAPIAAETVGATGGADLHPAASPRAMAQQVCVVLSTAEREPLAAIAGDRNRPRKHVERARIVPVSADRHSAQRVAQSPMGRLGNRDSGERNRLCGTDWYLRELICRGPERDTAVSDAQEARCASVRTELPQRSVSVRDVRRGSMARYTPLGKLPRRSTSPPARRLPLGAPISGTERFLPGSWLDPCQF